MILQIIDRIVRRTNDFHIHPFHDRLGAEFGCLQLGCTFVIDLAGGGRVQHLVYTEDTAQLEVSPMIERITHGMLHGVRPFFKLLVSWFVSRDIFFRYAVGTHGAPFVVVSTKPYLRQVGKLVVVGYLLWDQVAVIIDDRHFRCVFVIQFLGGIRLEQEIGIEKCLHTISGLCC